MRSPRRDKEKGCGYLGTFLPQTRKSVHLWEHLIQISNQFHSKVEGTRRNENGGEREGDWGWKSESMKLKVTYGNVGRVWRHLKNSDWKETKWRRAGGSWRQRSSLPCNQSVISGCIAVLVNRNEESHCTYIKIKLLIAFVAIGSLTLVNCSFDPIKDHFPIPDVSTKFQCFIQCSCIHKHCIVQVRCFGWNLCQNSFITWSFPQVQQ